MTKIEEVIRTAQREIGVCERPKSSNNVKYNTWYYRQEVWDGKNGGKYPWCMAFVQWVFNEAGCPLPYKTASCSALLDWYRKNKPSAVQKTPAPGDIVIYRGHTGIFEKTGPDPAYMYVIEGNTAVGNDDNGGCVMRRYRKLSSAEAFIRAAEEEAASPASSSAAESGKRYQSLSELPSWARDEIGEIAASGAIKGRSGDLDLSEDMIRTLIIAKRMIEKRR